jgi:DNA invertase Pin-like site-specific DNA recombinase
VAFARSKPTEIIDFCAVRSVLTASDRPEVPKGAMANYGYARVSTGDQTIGGQVQQLTAAGCVRVYSDTISGVKRQRPGLSTLLAALGQGDVVIVSRLDRLGRSASDLIQIVERVEATGANLISLAEAIDTTNATGRMIFHIFASIAEVERQLIRERTMMGLAAAKAKGRLSGRPPLLTSAQMARAKKWEQEEKMTQTEIARALGVSESTWRRARARERQKSDNGSAR